MEHRHYRNPVNPDSTRGRCPVCHETVYSRAGIHPQCAVKMSDPPKPKGKPIPPVLGDQAATAPAPTAAAEAVLVPTDPADRSVSR